MSHDKCKQIGGVKIWIEIFENIIWHKMYNQENQVSKLKIDITAPSYCVRLETRWYPLRAFENLIAGMNFVTSFLH